MERLEAYFAMGGYAAYVWPTLIVAAAVMVGQVVVSLRTLRRREAALAQLEAGARRRRQPGVP